MDRRLCFVVLFSICFFHCFAHMINEHELVILASQLSEAECRELILSLYKKQAYQLVQSNRYMGDCDHDLKKWLQSKERDDDILVLPELQHALSALGRPALGQQLSVEVYKETNRNLQDFIDSDGLLIDKDIDRTRHG